MFERFTDRGRQVLVLAQDEARLLHHNFIGTEHLLLGLIREADGVAGRALASLGVTLTAAREKVRETIGPVGGELESSPPFTPRAKKVLELSLREALQLGHNYIGTEHFLLGLIREGEGVGAKVLGAFAPPERVRDRVTELLAEATSRPEASRSFFRPRRTTGPPTPAGPRLVRCSFCGRQPPESGRLVAGVEDAFICEECAEKSLSIFRDPVSPPWQRLTMTAVAPSEGEPSPTGPPPENEAEARSAIEAAFAAMYERSPDGAAVPAVEGGGNLGSVLDEAGEWARAQGGYEPATITVHRVSFLCATGAVVWYSLDSGNRTVFRHIQGRAVLTDEGWKVSRETFCGLLSAIGISCPPPP